MMWGSLGVKGRTIMAGVSICPGESGCRCPPYCLTEDVGRKDRCVLLCRWTDRDSAGGFRTSRHTDTSWYDFFKIHQVTALQRMTMVSIPVSNLSPLGICSSRTVRLSNEDSESQSPMSYCSAPAWFSLKLLINYSVLPWSYWRKGNNLEADVSKKLLRAPTWEYCLPWELLNSTQQVHSKLGFHPCQKVVHIQGVFTFKSPLSACFHQARLVTAFSWEPSTIY